MLNVENGMKTRDANDDKCMREAFERAMLPKIGGLTGMFDRSALDDRKYKQPWTQERWEGYQAAYHRTISAGELKEAAKAIDEHMGSARVGDYNDGIEIAKAAVLALGHTIEGE